MITGESGDVELDKLPLNFSAINSGRILWNHLTSDPSQIVPYTPESVLCFKWVKIWTIHILHAIISYLRISLFHGLEDQGIGAAAVEGGLG